MSRDFGASGCYLDNADGGFVNFTAAWTAQAWTYFDTVVPNGQIMNHEFTGGGAGIPVVLGIGAGGGEGASSHVYTGFWNGGGWINAVDPSVAPTGAWVHWCGTYDGTNVRLYKNGTQVATNTGSPPAAATAGNDFYIGRLFNGNTHPDGRIAECAIWNVGLSAGEVLSLANGSRPDRVRRPALKAYWPILGVGSPEPDYSGGANHMTVVSTLNVGANPPVVPFMGSSAEQEDQLGLAPVYTDAATVPLKFTIASVEVAPPTVYTDSATVYEDIQPSSVDVLGAVDSASVLVDLQASGFDSSPKIYTDSATVGLVFSVFGGECFSTAQIEVGGDAFARWFGNADVRWSTDANARWFAEALRSGVHC